jgi:calcium-dependent protein kinase
MVSEKAGKINNDYSLLNPPLGKGYQPIFIYAGAFGEVRKAVHKITHQTRAVKIISKRATTTED